MFFLFVVCFFFVDVSQVGQSTWIATTESKPATNSASRVGAEWPISIIIIIIIIISSLEVDDV